MAVRQKNGFGAGERSRPAGIYITHGNAGSDLNLLAANREFSADRPVYTRNPRLSKNNTRQIVRNYAGRSRRHELLGHSRSSWRPRLQPLQIHFRASRQCFIRNFSAPLIIKLGGRWMRQTDCLLQVLATGSLVF